MRSKQKADPFSVILLTEYSRYNYYFPCGQVMSYEMLRIVMIGYAKL